MTDHSASPKAISLLREQEVGNPPHGDADDRIEHGERSPQDEAEVGIVEPEVGLDRLGKDRDNLPVEIVEQVGKSPSCTSANQAAAGIG
jgi:hypothetical protein